MAFAVLVLMLTVGVDVAFGGAKLEELKKIRAEVEDQGGKLDQIIAALASGGSGGSGGSGVSVQEPEDGTYVPGVCPETLETGAKRTKCHNVMTNGLSGVYTVNIAGKATRVYCDMSTDGGGWIVVQRRMNGDVDFLRNWANYSNGFGDPDKEFWLGNDLLYDLTSRGSYHVRFDLADKVGTCKYAVYSKFRIESEDDNYKLATIGIYSGNAGNSFSLHEGMPFSTYDEEHDTHNTYNCALDWSKGAWWYKACHDSNLNGQYGNDNTGQGVIWKGFKGNSYSLGMSEIKIRPN